MKLHFIAIAIFSVFSSLLLAAENGGAAKKIESKPNIVIILADDMGYGDIACFNPHSKIATPHLDRLAADGVRFSDAHSGAAVCVPSRYALLTGRFAVRNKLQVRNGPIINKGRMTIASLLKGQGYKTAMVGKWHQGFELSTGESKKGFDYSTPLLGGPVDCGFDSFFGMHASLDIPPYFYIRDRSPVMPPTETVKASTSDGSEEGWNKIQGAFWREGQIAPDFKHSEVTPRFAKEAVDVIRSHGGEKNPKPLFLYLALPSPHTPWLPSNEFRGKSGAGMYGDFVMQVDSVVGQVLESLHSTGMERDTLVLFSSDNGPVWYDDNTKEFGHDSVGGLRGMKFSSWEGGHRMPMIARWPAKIAPDSVSEQTIVFSDVFATLAELVGLRKIPETMAEDSVSFLPYLMNSEKGPERRAPIVHDRQTLRDGDWKLILPRGRGKQGKKTPGELYNLREDLAEQNNLFSKNSERAQRMRETLQAILSSEYQSALFRETFDASFNAKRFTTPIPNKNTEVRDGVLWTRGASGGKYPPMVYLPVQGKDLTISFRYRHLSKGGSLWFFVDGDDGFGSVDHMLRVKLLRNGVKVQVDSHSLDPNHPMRQKRDRPADPISKAFRLNEFLPLKTLDLGANDWHEVKLVFKSDVVTMTLDDKHWTQTIVRPAFNAAKRKLLWMQNGGESGIEIDDIFVLPTGDQL